MLFLSPIFYFIFFFCIRLYSFITSELLNPNLEILISSLKIVPLWMSGIVLRRSIDKTLFRLGERQFRKKLDNNSRLKRWEKLREDFQDRKSTSDYRTLWCYFPVLQLSVIELWSSKKELFFLLGNIYHGDSSGWKELSMFLREPVSSINEKVFWKEDVVKNKITDKSDEEMRVYEENENYAFKLHVHLHLYER